MVGAEYFRLPTGITTGGAYLFEGPLVDVYDVTDAAVTFSGRGQADYVGQLGELAMADLNDDGRDDLIFGSDGSQTFSELGAGYTYVWWGR